MIYREYHTTPLSVIGFGGIVVSGETQSDADRYVAQAIDAGINYFDVAPSYGNAEERLGPALRGKRNKVFLACKTEKRSATEAQAALENSLRVLETDCFDLYQLHGVSTLEEVDTILSPGGALEVLTKAQKDGKVKHLGFSAHTEAAALALFDAFPFASVLTPINWASLLVGNSNGHYGDAIIKKAQEKNACVLALKAMAKKNWDASLPESERPYPKCWYEPIDDAEHARLALMFSLSQPIVAAIPPGDVRLFDLAVKIAQDFTSEIKLSTDEIERLKAYASGYGSVFPQK